MGKVRSHPSLAQRRRANVQSHPWEFSMKPGARGRWLRSDKTRCKSWNVTLNTLQGLNTVLRAIRSGSVTQGTKDRFHKVPSSHGQTWEPWIGTLWDWPRNLPLQWVIPCSLFLFRGLEASPHAFAKQHFRCGLQSSVTLAQSHHSHQAAGPVQ